jgi:uncharacterized membrane protein
MKLKVLEFLGIVLIALVTGVFWGTWFTLTRSIETFSPESFLAIGKTIIGNVAVPMRVLIPGTLLVQFLACWFVWRQNRTVFYLYVLAFLLMIVTLIITVGVEVPIDNQIKSWTVDHMPDNWESLRARWDKFHTLRTFTSIASLCSFSAGVIRARLI